jgi:hypothetical protein
MNGDQEVKKLSKDEISQQQSSHIVDNGEKKIPKDVNEAVWKKLRSLQRQNRELREDIKQIKKAVTPKGGVQPSKKDFKLIKETETGEKNFTNLGEDIYSHALSENRLTTQDLAEILSEHGISRSRPTQIKYLQDIPGKLNPFLEDQGITVELKFKKGKQGGRNGGTPARVKTVDQ